VAAGPAMELQQMLRNDPAILRAGRAEITLLDQDASALKHAREQLEAIAARAGVNITLRCLSTPIRTVIKEGLNDYLIYSAGLFDYLKDSTALMLDWPLLHRTTGDLSRLFGDLGTGITIEQEATGVNLFAVISA
jgi:hypothetical protein